MATTVYPAFSLSLGVSPSAVIDGDSDVITDPIILEYGIRTGDPADRVAGAGTLKWTLDNSESNVNALLGAYSMFHASRRAQFDFNIPVSFSLSCPQVSAGIPYYKFYGKLDNAPASAGRYGDRRTRCGAVDIFDDFGNIDEPEIDVQINQRADQIVTAIFDAMTTQPLARDIEVGSDVLTYALDGGTGQKLKVRERLQQLCLSEVGYCYPIGGTTTPGTVRFENRQHRARNPDVLFTFDNDMVDLPVPASRADLFSKIQVVGYPTNDVSTAVPIVLYSLQTTQILVQPGEMNDAIFGPYRDPVNNDQIGGDTSSMTDPAPVTDYMMNTAADGSGLDVTANFTVTTMRTGAGVRFVITNTGSYGGYVTKLQQQGKPIYRYEAIIERSLVTTYGEKILQFVMPFQNNLNVCRDAADYLSTVHSARVGRPPTLKFLANESATFMEAALAREPGDRIAISEEVTGLSSAEFTINGVRLELQVGGILWCTWYLEPASTQQFWLIGVAGSSEIGSTTYPGF